MAAWYNGNGFQYAVGLKLCYTKDIQYFISPCAIKVPMGIFNDGRYCEGNCQDCKEVIDEHSVEVTLDVNKGDGYWIEDTVFGPHSHFWMDAAHGFGQPSDEVTHWKISLEYQPKFWWPTDVPNSKQYRIESHKLKSEFDAVPKYAPINENELKHLHDVEIKTTTGTIPCNSFLLSSRSYVFTAMFASGMKEAVSKTVTIDDFNYDTIRNMIHYLHGQDLAKNDYDNELLKIADKYNIQRLKLECELRFTEELDLDNVVKIWILSHQCQA